MTVAFNPNCTDILMKISFHEFTDFFQTVMSVTRNRLAVWIAYGHKHFVK